jgi:hypothetical protein
LALLKSTTETKAIRLCRDGISERDTLCDANATGGNTALRMMTLKLPCA